VTFKSLVVVFNENSKIASESISILDSIEKYCFIEPPIHMDYSTSSNTKDYGSKAGSSNTKDYSTKAGISNTKDYGTKAGSSNHNTGSINMMDYRSEDDSMSDGEIISNPKNSTRTRPEWKLQIQALSCLESLTRQSPKQMYSHWTKYLPSNLETRKSLMYIILQHPSELVCQAACRVVIAFFNGAKQYLSIASHG
jgi:Domain of unknown function (DUF4042)